MVRTPRLMLILAALVLAASSLMCSIGPTDELTQLEELEAAVAFETSNAQFTQTANAAAGTLVTEGAEPTATDPAPTATTEPTVAPTIDVLVVFELADEAGDTVNCITGEAADDAGSDIVNVQVVEPPPGSDHEALVAIIHLARLLGEFLNVDFSFAISLTAYLADGGTTSFLFERHDNIDRIGQEDENRQVIPNTENTISQTPDGTSIMVNLPPTTTKFDVYSFHTPSKDSPDDFFCDMLTGITVPNGS